MRLKMKPAARAAGATMLAAWRRMCAAPGERPASNRPGRRSGPVGFGALIAAFALALSGAASAATIVSSTASVTFEHLYAEASIVCNPGCGGIYDPDYVGAGIHLEIPGLVIPAGSTLTNALVVWNFPSTFAVGGAALMAFEPYDGQPAHPPSLGSSASLYSHLDNITSGGAGGALYLTTPYTDFHTGSVDLLAKNFGAFILAGDSVMVNGGAQTGNINPTLNIPDWADSIDSYVGLNSSSTFRLIATFPPQTATATLYVTYEPPALDPSAVPEPATWALMLIGFGGVGGLLRHRRTAGGLGLT